MPLSDLNAGLDRPGDALPDALASRSGIVVVSGGVTMLGRTTFVTAAAGTVLVLSATAASAHSCANVSRPAPPCGMTCTTVVSDGHWVWLPSLANIGIPNLPPVWGFDPPANFTNGATESLLGTSAICSTGGVPARQTEHGIQSGCE
jgi:hypothetical protein